MREEDGSAARSTVPARIQGAMAGLELGGPGLYVDQCGQGTVMDLASGLVFFKATGTCGAMFP